MADEKSHIEPFLEPQPAKRMYLYVCDSDGASSAFASGAMLPLRRATYDDIGKCGFAPEAIPKRIWLAIAAADEWMAAKLDEYEDAEQKFGENEGKRRLAELRTALHAFGYNQQADYQGWNRG